MSGKPARILAGVVVAASLGASAALLAQQESQDASAPATAPAPPANVGEPFTPPADTAIPDDAFGELVRYGRSLFLETAERMPEHVGNVLTCGNCHLDAGKLANSAPMWGAWVSYPAYRAKTGEVNTLNERVRGCFEYSMNGTPPAPDSREIKALLAYMYWMSRGAPTGATLRGRGYPALEQPAQAPDPARGEAVYSAYCAVCHGEDGQGQRAHGAQVFPPLWGERSYNWGAGMHRINTAAAFIRANMPLGQPGTLSVQEAWDVAAYVNGFERPQDPRWTGSVAETDARFHDHQCLYGDTVGDRLLGSE